MATPNESSALTDLQGIKDGELDDNSDVESKVGIPCKTTGRGRHPIHSRGAVDALTALQTTTGYGVGNHHEFARQGAGAGAPTTGEDSTQISDCVDTRNSY